MAKDEATRQVWLEDKAFLSLDRGTDPKSFRNRFYFKESDMFYNNPCSSSAFYHRAVKVKGTVDYHIAKVMKQNS